MSKAKAKPAPAATETEAQARAEDAGHAQADAQQKPAGLKLTPVSKITVATVCGGITMAAIPPLFIGDAANPQPNPAKELKVCRIAGFASGVKSGNSTYGEWHALTGEFAATNYLTGEIFAGKTCIIPAAMGAALVTATESALSEDATAKVRFSVDISVSRSPREPDKKYVYTVRPVIEAELSSPALALLSMS